jgi:hypothetical protein
MRFASFRVGLLALVAVAATVHSATAVTLRIDYSKDSGNFFSNAMARAALEEAAAFYSGILEDTLSGIETPPKYFGSIGGEVSFHWRRSYMHPGTGVTTFETDIENSAIDMDADEVLVFVGARDLAPGELGLGGPGGLLPVTIANVPFTAAENTEWQAMRDEFESSVLQRQETTGFARWGGSIAFDNNTNWHFDPETEPGAGQTDFYATALHELAHVLGFGAGDDDPTTPKTEWEELIASADEPRDDGMGGMVQETIFRFTGTKTKVISGSSNGVELQSADDTSHWFGDPDSPLMSTVYGETEMQTLLMSSAIDEGISLRLTNLDAAALVDIGWEIDLPSAAAAASLASDSTISNGSSSGSSISSSFMLAESAGVAAVSGSVVPEPAGSLLAVLAAVFTCGLRGQRSAATARR